MSATVQVARDEMLARFKAIWDAGPQSTGLTVIYPDSKKDPPASGAWARVTIIHNLGGQATLSGEAGARRFRREGTLFVQIFTEFGKGQTLSDQLVAISMKAFEGYASPSGVWFRNVRLQEVGHDGAFFQVNVLADFEYDEVR